MKLKNLKKIVLLSFLPLLISYFSECDAVIEQIEATPRPSSGITLGDLSIPQTVMLFLVVLQSLILYSLGIFPVEFDLRGLNRMFPGAIVGRSLIQHNIENKTTEVTSKKKSGLISLLLDCPMQYLCDVDFWVHRPHDSYFENMIASWFRNNESSWTDQDLKTFGGAGTCQEMHPCPYDIQQVVGIRIPGSRNITISDEQDDVDLHLDLF